MALLLLLLLLDAPRGSLLTFKLLNRRRAYRLRLRDLPSPSVFSAGQLYLPSLHRA